MIVFKSPHEYEQSMLYNMLCQSYTGLVEAWPEYADAYRARWHTFEDNTYDHPETFSHCVLISTVDDHPVGLVGAFVLMRCLSIGLSVSVLLVVALLACFLPARRAAKTDPMEALRYE